MTGKVAIVSGAAEGIGAGLVADYRGQGWTVVASARTIAPSEDPDVFTLKGDITGPETADRTVGGALGRFGHIDTLVLRHRLDRSVTCHEETGKSGKRASPCTGMAGLVDSAAQGEPPGYLPGARPGRGLVASTWAPGSDRRLTSITAPPSGRFRPGGVRGPARRDCC